MAEVARFLLALLYWLATIAIDTGVVLLVIEVGGLVDARSLLPLRDRGEMPRVTTVTRSLLQLVVAFDCSLLASSLGGVLLLVLLLLKLLVRLGLIVFLKELLLVLIVLALSLLVVALILTVIVVVFTVVVVRGDGLLMIVLRVVSLCVVTAVVAFILIVLMER